MKISYQFRHNDKTLRDFEIDIAKPALPRPGKGEWTRLSRNKCANCTLRDDQVSHCPPAVDLEEVVDAFNEVISHEDVFVIVDINERHILKDGDAQSGLSALMGLIMANSACPVLGRLRGLTRTHTPFQSVEETLFRFIGAYYLGQMLEEKRGGQPDWSLDGLHALFDDLMVVNKAFKARIHSATRQDAAMNAISALAMHALGAQLSLDGCEDELAEFAIQPAAS